MKHITITVKSELEDIEPYLKDFFTEMKRHDEVTDFSIKTSTFTARPETEHSNNKSISNHEAAEILKLMPKQSNAIKKAIEALEQEPKTEWIPVSKRLPEDLEPVNITWVNHNPEAYYADIKDKPFTATGVYFNGQWYWWSTLCADILAEYSHNYDDVIDDDIKIIAWQPLPAPCMVEPQESEDKE